MEDWKAITILDQLKDNYDWSPNSPRMAMDRGIDALYFEIRARELFQAVLDLLNKQKESICTLNILEQTVNYDDCENDTDCLMEDIRHLLIDNS